MKIENKTKRFAKQLLSNVTNALGSVYFTAILLARRVKWLEKQKNNKLQQCSLANCFSLRKAVKNLEFLENEKSNIFSSILLHYEGKLEQLGSLAVVNYFRAFGCSTATDF